jgi:D-alanine-D-alanine ligase
MARPVPPQLTATRPRVAEVKPVVFALIPHAIQQGRLVCEDYEHPGFRRALTSWLAALGLDWRWRPVTLAGTPEQRIEAILDEAGQANRQRQVVLFNFCDGVEDDGYPGLSVVRALEAAGLPFTGADAAFYLLTTSKTAMKQRMAAAGVATAPWVELRSLPAALERAEVEVGFPMMVKPDVSSASVGISFTSRVTDRRSLARQVEWLQAGGHQPGTTGGAVFVEPFLDGPEYTALVVEESVPAGVRVYPVVERLYHPLLPYERRFLPFELYEHYTPEQGLPELQGDAIFRYRVAPEEQQARLTDLSRRAFQALEGAGYARVDMRVDRASGETVVLEVTSNPGLGTEPDCSTGNICRLIGQPFAALVEEILDHAMVRRPSRQRLPVRL